MKPNANLSLFSKELIPSPIVVTFILFIIVSLFYKSQLNTITPQTAEAPDQVFSSERAFNLLEIITKEQIPHPVDSLANNLVEQRIIELLTTIGLSSEVQESQLCDDYTNGLARCTKVRNIIAKIQGTDLNNKGILLSAHYDSVPAGPGGSDAGAAVVTLLEVARLLTLSPQPKNTIVLLFNEGEEFGLFGAKAFMREHPYAKELTLALNVEARGTSGKSVMFETGENSGWLVNHYAQTTPSPVSSSLFYEIYKALPNNTDLTIFKDHGLQGLNFAHAERLPHYHTPLDNLTNLDKGSLQHHGDNVWGVLQRIKDQDLEQVELGNLVYSDILHLFVISWPEPYSLWISLLALVLWFFSVGLSRYKLKKCELNSTRLTPINIIKLVLTPTSIVLLSALTAYFIMLMVQTLSDYHSPWHANNLPMQLAVWLGVLTISLPLGKLMIKNLDVTQIQHSISLFWVALSLVTSIWLAGISFLFIIPAFTNIICQLLLNQLPCRQSSESITTKANLLSILLLILNATITAVIFIPVAYTIDIMMGYQLSVGIGLILGFVMVSTLPLLSLQLVTHQSQRKLIAFTLTLSVISIIWTAFQPPHTSWFPQRLSIHYIENEQGEAFLSYGAENDLIPASLTNSFVSAPKLSKLMPWQRSATYLAPVAADIATRDFAPNFNVLNQQQTNGKTRIVAKITTKAAALSDVKLFIPESSGLSKIKVNNQSLSYLNEPSKNGFYVYHCRGITCANIDITLEFSDYQAGQLYLSSAYPSLPKTLVHHLQARGSNSVASQAGDQAIRYRVFDF
jgi:hypothetical protein